MQRELSRAELRADTKRYENIVSYALLNTFRFKRFDHFVNIEIVKLLLLANLYPWQKYELPWIRGKKLDFAGTRTDFATHPWQC